MSEPAQPPFLAHFAALRDPRQAAKVLYPLPEILLLLLCATLSGADDFVEINLWGQEHMGFLRRFQPYERGIPSHDTLCDIIAAIDPEMFKTCFLAWVEGLRDDMPDVIAIDGKTSRRSHARSKGRMPLHTVSAWATVTVHTPPSRWLAAMGVAVDRPQVGGRPALRGKPGESRVPQVVGVLAITPRIML